MSRPKAAPLLKQKSWSPDTLREEVWVRRKERGIQRSKSLTDEDFEELKACIELGFGFDSPELESDKRLSDTLPALGFYFAVSRMSSSSSLATTSSLSPHNHFLSLPSPLANPPTIFTPGDDPKTIKTRLRQWAQAVACSVKQS